MNDDVQDVRRILARANPCPPGSLTGAGQDADGRSAFARVTTSDTSAPGMSPSHSHRLRMPRTGIRLVAVGGLAVTIAAGVTVAQNLGGVGHDGKPHSVLPGLPAGPVANAQVLLARAANSAQSRAFTPPRPGQWIYTEAKRISPGKPLLGQVQTPRSPVKTEIDRTWLRADGIRIADYENGKLVIVPTGGGMPPSDYATLAALPRDPNALLVWVDKQAAAMPKKQGLAFGLLGSILGGGMVLPPSLEATIYRTLAKIPGVTLNRDAKDIDGHPALGVDVIGGWMSQQILLDPTTYAYRGYRSIVIKDHTETLSSDSYVGKDGKTHFIPGGTSTVKKGTIDVLEQLITIKIVDRPGHQ